MTNESVFPVASSSKQTSKVTPTVTVNEHDAVFPPGSVAVQLTVVVPCGKKLPDAGVHTTVIEPMQLSVVVGAGYMTFAPGTPPCIVFAVAVTFAGHVIVGACVSVTVTLNVHVAVFAAASVAVQVTVVVPTGKDEPDAGTHAVVTPGQLSLAVGAG